MELGFPKLLIILVVMTGNVIQVEAYDGEIDEILELAESKVEKSYVNAPPPGTYVEPEFIPKNMILFLIIFLVISSIVIVVFLIKKNNNKFRNLQT